MIHKPSVQWLPAICLIGLLFVSILPTTSAAQTDQTGSVEVPEALGPEAISELVSKMDPKQTEALSNLVGLLSSSVGEDMTDSGAKNSEITSTFAHWIEGFSDVLVTHVVGVPETLVGIWRGVGSIFAGREIGNTFIFLLLTTLVIIVGLAVEKLFDRAFAMKREEIRKTTPESLLETLKLLSIRALIEIGDVALFTIAALITTRILFSNPTDLFIVSMLVLKAILIFRIVSAVLKFILAPVRTDLRLVSTDDWTARYVYRHFSAIAGFLGFAFFLLAVSEGNGIEISDSFRFWISVTANLWIIGVTWKARKGLTSIILGDETILTPGLERMAVWWPPISIAIIADPDTVPPARIWARSIGRRTRASP